MDEVSKEVNKNRDVPIQEIKMIFTLNPTDDQRRYNRPICNEVAVVYVGDEMIISQKKNNLPYGKEILIIINFL